MREKNNQLNIMGIAVGLSLFVAIIIFSSNSQANRRECPQGLSNFTFAGQNFVGNVPPRTTFCVSANSDNAAKDACFAVRGEGFRHMDPGSNQYSESAGNSSLGWYYCLPGSSNLRAQMCAQANSRSPNENLERFGWDGERCSCFIKNNGGQIQDCSQPNSSAIQERIAQARQASEPPATETPAEQEEVEAAVASVPATRNMSAFLACLEQEQSVANRCRTTSERANTVCDADNNNNGNTMRDIASGVLGAAGTMYSMANANTGTQGNCFKAGLMANGARLVLEQTNDQCSGVQSACTEQCGRGEEKYNEFKQNCAQYLPEGLTFEALKQGTYEATEGTSPPTAFGIPMDDLNSAKEALSRADGEIEDAYQAGINNCTGEAARRKNVLEDLLTGVGNALQQSLVCACQTAANGVTAGGNCAIPTPNECEVNPNLANCNVYPPMNVCTPGAGYNATACNCQMNPTSAGCTTDTGNGVSSFAGGAINPASGDTVSFGALAGGGAGRASNLDLSSAQEARSLGFANNGDGASGLAESLPKASGGGGMAGGGMAGGGMGAEGGEGPVVAAEDQSLMGSFMNQMKSLPGRFLGGGKQNANGGIRVNSKKPVDTTFRPRGRGVASNNGVGSKNMDIWRMMNQCVQGDTCKRNVNNYILTP